MPDHRLLEHIAHSLTSLLPAEPVELRGEWSTNRRQTYRSAAQLGSGSGPFSEVVDSRWRGTLVAPTPITGIAVLVASSGLYWVKAARVSPTLHVEVSLHAYAGYRPEHATLATSLEDAILPGVPVETSPELPADCIAAPNVIATARPTCIARMGGVAFFVVLFRRDSVKFGRNRLWRLRDSLASDLPAHVREVLTRRRAGVVRAEG